jgi:hypothetical protein
MKPYRKCRKILFFEVKPWSSSPWGDAINSISKTDTFLKKILWKKI